MTRINDLIKKINNQDINIVNGLSEDDLEQLIIEADYAYHNTNKPIFPDSTYDIIKQTLEKINPKNPILDKVGAPIKKEVLKVNLPYWMGSMDKIKPDTNELKNWLKKYKNEYVISDKLDGASAMFYSKDNKQYLYTRGNGKVGQDITNLLKFVKNIPKVNTNDTVAIRGELIMTKENFKKFEKENANPRNTVSGVINSKKPNMSILKHIDFISYELLEPSGYKLSEQFDIIKKYKFDTVYHEILKENELTNENLSKLLEKRRESSPYEIDGLIVTNNEPYKKVESGNPKHAFAYKTVMTSNRAEVVVLSVDWNVSKDKLLKPLVNIDPVKLGGVTIKKVTGFNAHFIEKNKIGPGSVVIITRSGDVIPNIIEIIKESNNGEPSMPKEDFKWVSQFEIELMGTTKESQLKNIENFFVKMKVDGLSKGIVKKLFINGYDTIKKILDIKKSDLLKIEGFKEKSSTNLINSLDKIFKKDIDCIQLMSASNVFGRGFAEKKLLLIIEKFPKIVEGYKPKMEDIVKIEGIQTKTAENFIKGIEKFQQFLKENQLKCVLNIKKEVSSKLENKNIVFTGFRDKGLEEKILDNKGKVTNTINKNTSYLIVKDISDSSSKIEKAKQLNIDILTKEEFIKKYNF